jgi:hypothetical protein
MIRSGKIAHNDKDSLKFTRKDALEFTRIIVQIHDELHKLWGYAENLKDLPKSSYNMHRHYGLGEQWNSQPT